LPVEVFLGKKPGFLPPPRCALHSRVSAPVEGLIEPVTDEVEGGDHRSDDKGG
jgi:hypothetical protein